MRTRFAPLAVAVTIALGAACAPAAPPPPDTDAMIAAADALDERFMAAFNAGDVATLQAMYWNSPDAVSFPPDAMIHRGTATRDGIAAMVAGMQAAGAKLELTEKHHMVIGDAVATWGLWTMTMSGPDGAPMQMQGRFTDIKAERDGQWVYLMDHASVPLPPAPGGN